VTKCLLKKRGKEKRLSDKSIHRRGGGKYKVK